MWDEYGEYHDPKTIRSTTFLYELRHAINIFGLDEVAEGLKTDEGHLERLYDSPIHGNNGVLHLFRKSSEEFNRGFNHLLQKQRNRDKEIESREELTERKIEELEELRETALGIGTRKIKLRLNKLQSTEAKFLRMAMEIEDKSVQAKKSYGKYVDKIYAQKHILIHQLIKFCEQHSIVCGRHRSTIPGPMWVVFFEIPVTNEQISFHTDLDHLDTIPDYPKKWDGQEFSTFKKILSAIQHLHPEIIY